MAIKNYKHDYYKILNIPFDARTSDIDSAHDELVKKHLSDLSAVYKIKLLDEARNVLTSSEREAYDEFYTRKFAATASIAPPAPTPTNTGESGLVDTISKPISTAVSINPAKSSNMSYEVTVKNKDTFSVPPMCVCCLDEFETAEPIKYKTSYTFSKSTHEYTTTYSLGLDFMICKACTIHASSYRLKVDLWLLSSALLTLFIGMAALLSISSQIPPLRFALIISVISVVLGAVFSFLFTIEKLDAAHSSRIKPVRMTSVSKKTTNATASVSFVFFNQKYAENFAKLNDGKIKKTSMFSNALGQKMLQTKTNMSYLVTLFLYVFIIALVASCLLNQVSPFSIFSI